MAFSNFVFRCRQAILYGKSQGVVALFHLVRKKLSLSSAKSGSRMPAMFGKTDVIGFYDFVRYRPFNAVPSGGTPSPRSVNWFIPPCSRGSGGHLNIFRFVSYLEQFGYDCRIVIVGEPAPQSSDRARKEICDWFFPIKARVFVDVENVPPSIISVATSWQTAYAVRNFQDTKRKFYFVQDFEPWFYAVGSEYAFAQQTYTFGFAGITAGQWLKEKLSQEYGMETHSVGFSYDHERYRPRQRREPHIKRVFFYARPPTPRRAFELGMLVLAEVTRVLPDVKVVLAGWDVSVYSMPFECLNAGIVDLDDLPDLYSQCDVALVLSFSNLSLLPLELMACGTPVVSNAGPHTEWLLNSDNALLVDSTVEALSEAVVEVLQNDALSERLRAGGLETARLTDWKSEALKMAAVFDAAMAQT